MSFEQAAENAASDHELGLIDTAILSQAISLKRIADALEKLVKPPVLYASKEDAEEWEKANKNMGFAEYKR